ncbi:MAG: dihydroorotate dehydrogenase electron transfer subunit [Lachnospiraceae bacterium]|nr:dihydroorotate dehydrogenase electron transfer subunit [Lachnospiraceae bacterium]
MEKSKEMITSRIISQEEIAPGVYDLRLEAEAIVQKAVPGQFVNVYLDTDGKLLPRPISICEADVKTGTLRLVYRVAGEGTKLLARKPAGHHVRILGPLGNGFPMEGQNVFLIGGGIGIPPMLELAKRFPGDVQIVLGYADKNLFLAEELGEYGPVYVSTDDGSRGTSGNVIDAMRANDLKADVIYACGPKPMLRSLKEYAMRHEMTCWLSMEERMACGVGACLGCVCETTETDAHSNVKNKRVCKDGPVFRAEEIQL